MTIFLVIVVDREEKLDIGTFVHTVYEDLLNPISEVESILRILRFRVEKLRWPE